MKKLSALLLAALLAFSFAASAHADVGQWVNTDMSGYREIWYVDYNRTVLNHIGSPTSGASASGDGAKWIIDRCFVAGYETGALLGTEDTGNVVPVDLTVDKNTVYVYAIVTRRVVIGLLFVKVNVDEGTMTVEGQVKDGEVYFKGQPTLTVYLSVSGLLGDGVPCEAGEPMSIADDLGGAGAVLIALEGLATYYGIVSSDAGDDGSLRKFALQEYWKNEDAWKTYRTRMLDAMGKVAE